MTRREKHLERVLNEYPFLWAISNLWSAEYPPVVTNPSKEIFSQPFPKRFDHSGNVSVWVHLKVKDGGPKVYPSPSNRIYCPRFEPFPDSSIGKVLYHHYVRTPEDMDDWNGELHNVVLAGGQSIIGDVERLCLGGKIQVIPSRKSAPLADLLKEWFG